MNAMAATMITGEGMIGCMMSRGEETKLRKSTRLYVMLKD